MKKLWIVLTLLLLSVSSAQAHTGHFGHRPFHPHFGAHAYVPPHYRPHYRPHYPHRYYTPLPEVLAGIVGTTVGSYFIGSQYQPSHDSSTYCFTLISDNGKRALNVVCIWKTAGAGMMFTACSTLIKKITGELFSPVICM